MIYFSEIFTHKGQRGVALITAMLIAALVTVAAVAMASRQTLDMRRTGNMLEVDQAYMYALGMEELAVQVLAKDKSDAGDIDTLNEDWAMPLPPTTVEGGTISGRLTDMQARFNLNNTVNTEQKADPVQIRMFQSLLQQVSKANQDLQISPFVANRIADWIDADLNTSADGAEDFEYLGADTPYRAANRFMASPSELGAILGMSPPDVEMLIPFISTLPVPTTINVNTAPAEVMMSLNEKMTDSIADALVEYRKDNPFKNKTEFEQKLQSDYNIKIDNKLFDIKSDYFMVSVDATIGRTHLTMYSLLERGNDKVATLSRSIGTY